MCRDISCYKCRATCVVTTKQSVCWFTIWQCCNWFFCKGTRLKNGSSLKGREISIRSSRNSMHFNEWLERNKFFFFFSFYIPVEWWLKIKKNTKAILMGILTEFFDRNNLLKRLLCLDNESDYFICFFNYDPS